LLAAVVGAATVALLTASPPDAAAATKAPQDTKPESSSVLIPISAVSAQAGPTYYVGAAGFYSKYGLDATQPIVNSAQVTASFESGTPEIANAGMDQVLTLAAAGVPVTIIGCTMPQVPFQIYASKSITKPTDLKGKTIGVTAIGSTTQISAEQYLAKHGLAPSDVQFVGVGSVPNVLAALQAGRIDAGILSYPSYGVAAQDSDLRKVGDAASVANATIVPSSWAKKNRNTILAYLRAFTEGWASYNTNETAALPVLAKFLNLNLDDPTQAATVKAGYDTYRAPGVEPPAHCDASAATSILKFLTPEQRAILNRPKTLFDNQYTQALSAEGFYAKMRKKYGDVPGLPA
jgi:ABC-type nitrate/sulfonate/bicarbonate transport system substrate-binding protein